MTFRGFIHLKWRLQKFIPSIPSKKQHLQSAAISPIPVAAFMSRIRGGGPLLCIARATQQYCPHSLVYCTIAS